AAESEIIQVFVLNHIFDLLIINQKIGSKQIGLVFCIIRHIVECIILHTWVGFIFMVIVLVVVMQIFEKVKEQLLKWTID
ncbi:MAG: ABC transporter permease, partial [Blautia wexlerae]